MKPWFDEVPMSLLLASLSIAMRIGDAFGNALDGAWSMLAASDRTGNGRVGGTASPRRLAAGLLVGTVPLLARAVLPPGSVIAQSACAVLVALGACAVVSALMEDEEERP